MRGWQWDFCACAVLVQAVHGRKLPGLWPRDVGRQHPTCQSPTSPMFKMKSQGILPSVGIVGVCVLF